MIEEYLSMAEPNNETGRPPEPNPHRGGLRGAMRKVGQGARYIRAKRQEREDRRIDTIIRKEDRAARNQELTEADRESVDPIARTLYWIRAQGEREEQEEERRAKEEHRQKRSGVSIHTKVYNAYTHILDKMDPAVLFRISELEADDNTLPVRPTLSSIQNLFKIQEDADYYTQGSNPNINDQALGMIDTYNKELRDARETEIKDAAEGVYYVDKSGAHITEYHGQIADYYMLILHELDPDAFERLEELHKPDPQRARAAVAPTQEMLDALDRLGQEGEAYMSEWFAAINPLAIRMLKMFNERLQDHIKREPANTA